MDQVFLRRPLFSEVENPRLLSLCCTTVLDSGAKCPAKATFLAPERDFDAICSECANSNSQRTTGHDESMGEPLRYLPIRPFLAKLYCYSSLALQILARIPIQPLTQDPQFSERAMERNTREALKKADIPTYLKAVCTLLSRLHEAL